MNNSNIQKISNDLRRLPVMYDNLFKNKENLSLATVYDYINDFNNFISFRDNLESEINSLSNDVRDEYKDQFNKLVDSYRQSIEAINTALNNYRRSLDVYKLNDELNAINKPSVEEESPFIEITPDNEENMEDNNDYVNLFEDTDLDLDIDQIPTISEFTNNYEMPLEETLNKNVPNLEDVESGDDSSTSDDDIFEEVDLDNPLEIDSPANIQKIEDNTLKEEKEEEEESKKEENDLEESNQTIVNNIKNDINEISNIYNKVMSDIDNFNTESYDPTYTFYNDVLRLNYQIAKAKNEVNIISDGYKPELENLLAEKYTKNMELVVEDLNAIVSRYREEYSNISLLDYLLKNLDRRVEPSLSSSSYNKTEEIYKLFKKTLIDDIDKIDVINEETLINYFDKYNKFLDKDKEIRNKLTSAPNNSEVEKITETINKFWDDNEVIEYFNYIQEVYKEYSMKKISSVEASKAIKALKTYKDAITNGSDKVVTDGLLRNLNIESWAIIGKKYEDFIKKFKKEEIVEVKEDKTINPNEIESRLIDIRNDILSSIDKLAIIDSDATNEFIAHFEELDSYIKGLETSNNEEVKDVIHRFFNDLINKLTIRSIRDFNQYYANTKDNATYVNYLRSVARLVKGIEHNLDYKNVKKDAYEVLNAYKKYIGKEPLFSVAGDLTDYVKNTKVIDQNTKDPNIVDLSEDDVRFVDTTSIPLVTEKEEVKYAIAEQAKVLYRRLMDFRLRYDKELDEVSSKKTIDKNEFELYKLSLLVDLKSSYNLNEQYLSLFETPEKITLDNYIKIQSDKSLLKEHSDLIDIDRKVYEVLGQRFKEELKSQRKTEEAKENKEEKDKSILDKFVGKINDIKSKVFKVVGELPEKAREALKMKKKDALRAAFVSLASLGVVGFADSVISQNNVNASAIETNMDGDMLDDKAIEEAINTVEEIPNVSAPNTTMEESGDTMENAIEEEKDPVVINGVEYQMEDDGLLGEITIGDYVTKTNPKISSSMYQESTAHAYFDDEPSVVVGVVYANHENDTRVVAKTMEDCKKCLEHGGYPVMYKVVNAKVYEKYAGNIDDINKIVEGYLAKEDVMEVSPDEVSEYLEVGRSL